MSRMSRRERLELLMQSTGWDRRFADEYLLQREYHCRSHEQAFLTVMNQMINANIEPEKG